MQTADDFDGCWKEALDTYFPQFMALLWPSIAAQIDWAKPHEFLDKELQKLVGKAQTGTRRVDKLVKVWMRDGRERWFLIHIEIQARLDTKFAVRTLTYHTRLLDRYAGVPVESLVVVTHSRPPPMGRLGRHPQYRWRYRPRLAAEAHAMLPGFHDLRYDARNRSGRGLVLHFSVLYLADWRAHWTTLEAIARHNPFALVVLAQLEAAASRDGLQRLASKTRIARLMYTYGYTRDDVFRVFRLIDWMIRLPEALEPQFADEMQRIEAEDEMAYVTSIERVGEKRGQAQLLRHLLTRKFGALPDWVETELVSADDEQLLLWADRVLEEVSLKDVFAQ